MKKKKKSEKEIKKKKPQKKSKKEITKKPNIKSKDKKTPLLKKDSKPKKIIRVSSGIKNFDKISQGGFEKDSTNLLIGSAGTGKTIFAIQFLIEGIKKKENVLYVSFEESKDELYLNMKELGIDLEKLEKQGKFYFLEYTPRKIRSMLEEGGGVIENLVLSKGIKRISIDSITSFMLLFDNEIEKRKSILALFDLLRGWDCTSVLTFEGSPLKDGDDLSILEFGADSIILFYFFKNKDERQPCMEILKMKGTKHSKKIFPFSIEKNGINLKTKALSKEEELL